MNCDGVRGLHIGDERAGDVDAVLLAVDCNRDIEGRTVLHLVEPCEPEREVDIPVGSAVRGVPAEFADVRVIDERRDEVRRTVLPPVAEVREVCVKVLRCLSSGEVDDNAFARRVARVGADRVRDLAFIDVAGVGLEPRDDFAGVTDLGGYGAVGRLVFRPPGDVEGVIFRLEI